MSTFSVNDDIETTGNMTGYVYQLEDPEGFYYIGSTKDIKHRLSLHKTCLKKVLREPYLHFCKHDFEQLKSTVIEVVKYDQRKQLLEREEYYISLYISDPFCLNKNHCNQVSIVNRKGMTRYWSDDKNEYIIKNE